MVLKKYILLLAFFSTALVCSKKRQLVVLHEAQIFIGLHLFYRHIVHSYGHFIGREFAIVPYQYCTCMDFREVGYCYSLRLSMWVCIC